MANKKTYDEQIADIDKKQQQLKERKKILARKKREEERKKRTHRLIEIGGLVESVLGRKVVEGDLIRFKEFLLRSGSNGNYFERAMRAKRE